MSEQDEVQSDSADFEQSESSKKKTRVRLLSPRKQLAVTIQRMEKLAQSGALKESKLCDLLLSMADTQKALLKITLDEEYEKLETERDQLAEHHDVDAKRISELEAENARLKSRPETRTVTVTQQDPEAAQLREQNAGLRELVTAVIKPLDEDSRARLAVHVIHTQTDRVARDLLPMLGMDYSTWWQMMHRNQTEQELLAQVENSTEWNWNGNLNVFARAALAVIHGVNISSKKPAKKKDFDPAIFGTLENQLAELGRKKTALLEQRNGAGEQPSRKF